MFKHFSLLILSLLDGLRKHQKNLYSTVKYASLTLVLLVLCFFTFRNVLLNYMANKYLGIYSEKYKANITIGKTYFTGIKTIELKNIHLNEHTKNNTLMYIGSISANLSFWDLLKTHVRFSELKMDTLQFHLVKKNGQDNFTFLLKNEAKKVKYPLKQVNYAEVSNNMLNLLFDIIPSDLNVNNLNFSLSTDSMNYQLLAPGIEIHDSHFYGKYILLENKDISEWQIDGTFDNIEKTTQLKMYSNVKSSLFPFFNSNYNLKISADTLSFSINRFNLIDHKLQLQGTAKLNHLAINHWRISPKNVIIDKCIFNYNVTVGNNYVQLDSTSSVQLNKISFLPYIKLQLSPTKKLTLNINTPMLDASDFFESLPTGLFSNLEGIKTSGKLDYQLRFKFDTKTPDHIVFSSSLNPHQFKIITFGASDLSKINNEFKYTVYDKDVAVRTFEVGSLNPNYTPIEQISPYLQNAILTSEDGNFYNHHGFNERRFSESIVQNYKQKRFVRGGSTISMQLVKNVFLRRNKTIARKLEEALIVWLIEHNRLSTKSRMYEVYLNIIELGPNVFGIGEASNFYFNKTPSQLNLEESIFLAMIVPRPKWFMYQFDEQGKLNENTKAYFSFIAEHLLSKGIITEDQKNNLNNTIELATPAKSLLLKKDTSSYQLDDQQLN